MWRGFIIAYVHSEFVSLRVVNGVKKETFSPSLWYLLPMLYFSFVHAQLLYHYSDFDSWESCNREGNSGANSPTQALNPRFLCSLVSGGRDGPADATVTVVGLSLWGWPMPPGTLGKFMISSGQSGSFHLKSWAYLKGLRSCSCLFYQLPIAIWRTIAQLGTSPLVAHCIQVIVVFL